MSQLRLCWRRNAQGRYWCVSVRRRPSGQGCEERTLWLGGHDWKVSTWSGDGHFQGSSGRDRIEGEPDGDRQAAAAKRGGEASNRRRDVVEGASVARVARAHGVNANQVFGWRRLYLAGRLGGSGAVKLLPVHVNESSPSLATPARSEDSCSTFSAGTIHIELRHAQVHIAGSADPVLLRVLLECLRG